MYALPFIVVLLTLIIIKDEDGKPSKKPYCIMSGILCCMACSVYMGNLTIYQCIANLAYTANKILVKNSILFLTLLLFGVLIRFIVKSRTIEEVSLTLNSFIKNKMQFLMLLIICALISSIDDYLACIILMTVFATCYKQFGFSKNELGFFINTIVVAFCSMVPISTWSPIIAESLSFDKELISINLYYLRYCFNYFTYFSLLTIMTMLLSKKSKEKSSFEINVSSKSYSNKLHKLTLIIGIIYLAYIIASKSNVEFFSNNALLVSCLSALIFCHIVFRNNSEIKQKNKIKFYMDGFSDMWGVVKFLYVLWIYTDCLENMLHMNETLLQQISQLDLPTEFLPVVAFVFSATISYCTGSVFATIRLLVPLSISLGAGLELSQTYLWLIATAAINGSLIASVSPLSDTMAICAKELKQDSNMMFKAHLPYSIMIIVSSIISYLIAGFYLNINFFVAVILPVCISIPIIVFYIIDIPYFLEFLNFDFARMQYANLRFIWNNKKCTNPYFCKHNYWRVKQLINKKYYSSSPKRTQPILRYKIC